MSSPQTTLSAAITTTNGTTCTVRDVLGFPATGTYTVLIDSEQILVGAGGSTTSWSSLTRGYNSTTAATHLDAATVSLVPEAYATLADVKASMQLPDTSRDAYVLDLLGQAAEHIDFKCGRRFYRNPLSGDGTFYVDVTRSGQSSLVLAGGSRTTSGQALDIISITTLSIRDDESDATYTTVSAGDTGYYLEPGSGPGAAGTGWPYEDILLSRNGTNYATYPVGRRAVTIVGALGFPAFPSAVVRANVDLAREWYRQGPGGGAPVGVNQYGTPLFAAGEPTSLRVLLSGPYARRQFVVAGGN